MKARNLRKINSKKVMKKSKRSLNLFLFLRITAQQREA